MPEPRLKPAYLSIHSILGFAALIRTALLLIALRDPQISIEPDNYFKMGLNIVESAFYNVEVFPPLYVYLCGLAAFLLKSGSLLFILILQAALSLASIFLVYKISLEIFKSESPALFAALIMAFEPSINIQSIFVLTETVYLFFICLAVLLFLRQSILTAGIILGLACLTRSVGIVLLPLFILILVLSKWKKREWLKPTFLFIIAFQGTIAPWCLRNYKTWNNYSISSSGPQNFAALFVGVAKMRAENRPLVANMDAWELNAPLTADEARDPFFSAKAYSQIAKTWVKENPVLFLKGLIIGQLNLFFGPYQGGWAQVIYGGEKADQKIPRPFLILLILWRILFFISAAIGFFFIFIRSCKKERNWQIFIMFFGLMGLHAAAIGAGGNARFLVPIIPFMALFSGLFCAYNFNLLKIGSGIDRITNKMRRQNDGT